MADKPRVLIVAGPDVDARIELMKLLSSEFAMEAAGSSTEIAPKFEKAGFPYYAYGMERTATPLSDFKTRKNLEELFARVRPDLVHTFDTKPCVWGRLAAASVGIPAVMGTITGLGALFTDTDLKTRIIRTLYTPLQKRACRVSHATIFYNHDDMDAFIRMGVVSSATASVIPGSGVQTERFSTDKFAPEEQANLRKEIGIQTDEIVITMITRVFRAKGVMEYVEAAERMKKTYPKVRFVLVGGLDTEVADRLNETEVERMKQAITWLGSRKDVAALLSISHIGVLPTYYREGIPRVLLESASLGLPLITTDTPGCKEVVRTGENGILIPPRSVDALQKAIIEIADNPALRQKYGEASRQRALSEFALPIIAEKNAQVYRRLLKR
ncbi:MAG: glycosyltransferase family 4 protein [Armatimonadetes bacterium]|nr:glycosyltransferase family 4 protein [Armatimonadota bacterium]